MQNIETNKSITATLIIGLSAIICAAILGIAFFQTIFTVKSMKTIHVVGSATKRYESDVAKWKVTILRTVDMNNLKTGYDLIQKDMRTIVDQLKSVGIQDKEITLQPIVTEPKMEPYRTVSLSDKEKQVGYNVRQTIFTISSDIPKLEKLALSPSVFLNKGILLESSDLEYFISTLSEIKRGLVAEATIDSKKRAEEIANNTGVKLGKLISGETGIFQITESYSTEVSDSGIHDTSTRVKDITITVTNTYAIN